ncbi:MAG TPA: Fic family protein [Bacilli bacterium]|nr:Fic family protein [Bacilli bacterium]
MKESYSPIFEIDDEIIELVSTVIKKLDTYKIHLRKKNIHLRKKNRIMSLQSTLAIENNSLSLKQVTDIINGKKVLGKVNEIQEVKNIYKAYENIIKYNPYDIKDFLKAHSYITSSLVSQSGVFRRNDVGIYDGHGNVVHMGARPQYINDEVNRLFKWLKESNTHPIIKSCIFHFEIEFIHPFEDGNGRIGRLWQTVILNSYNKVFEYLPIETVIYNNQKKYYDVLSYCSKNNNSTKFIKFMLIKTEL